MLDLGKPLGIHEDLIFYGDHENEKLVYYFPDEVYLSGRETGKSRYDLDFVVFQEGKVISGGLEDLEKTAGSILQLGVCCSVDRDRLKKALAAVKSENTFPEDTIATTPFWENGQVDLIVLDASTSDSKTTGTDHFVRSILGSQKPSLASSDLKSIFNVCMDRRGTELINAALNTGGSIAGVIYDLKYAALRPAVALKISADLGKCQQTATRHLDAGFSINKGINLSLGADLEWLTKKMEDNGDIKIELLSMVENNEQKKQVDAMVKDFKDSVLKTLFSAEVSGERIPAGIHSSALPFGMKDGALYKLGITYSLKKEKLEIGRKIEVDYRERSTVVRAHNPQAHLWHFGKQIGDDRSSYIKKVIFGDLFKRQELQVKLMNDFCSADNDLSSAEIIIWHRKNGLAEGEHEVRFALPASASKIVSSELGKDAPELKLVWTIEDQEDIGYYYQLRFLYSGKVQNVKSPREIVTPPLLSFSNRLTIVPDSYMFYKKIPIRCSRLDFSRVPSVDVSMKFYDPAGNLIDSEILNISEENPEDRIIIRGKDKQDVTIKVSKTFHLSDNRILETEPIELLDDEVLVTNPFLGREIIPMLMGNVDNFKDVLFHTVVRSRLSERTLSNTLVLHAQDVTTRTYLIETLTPEDVIEYDAKALVNVSGKPEFRFIQNGRIEPDDSGEIILDLSNASKTIVVLKWGGANPADTDIKKLIVTFKTEDGVPLGDPFVYKAGNFPDAQEIAFDYQGKLLMDVSKQLVGGRKEDGVKNFPITSREVVIK